MADNEHRAPEQRTVDVDVEAIDTRGRTLHGYAAIYNVESEDLGGFREKIAPGAFSGVLDADVRALLNHDPSQVLGRTKSGTLRLFDEQRGLRFEVDLPDSPLGENVREAVRRRDIDGASFRFRVDQESWQGDLRTIESVKELKDVTVATFGAYPAASVELRTRNHDGAEERQGDKMEDKAGETHEERTDERPPAGSLRVEDRTAPGDVRFRSLAELYEAAGFFEHRVAQVGWDEYRSFTWSGGTVSDINPLRREGVPLGYDQRWIYPVLPTTAVSDSTTSVQYLRQSTRTLAGTSVIRALDATSTKPETSTTAELATLTLSQVATVQTGIPRIMGAQPPFQSMVESDLRLSINDGLDELVRRGLVTAGTASTVTGNVLDKVRKAITVVQNSGYNPDVLAIDPAGSEALDLLKSSGSEQFYVFNAGAAAPAPYGLQVRVWKSGTGGPGTAVLDSGAFGRLYASPVELRSFEADGGVTNKTNVRMELNAGYAVERTSAGLRIL
jgi:HK97 family phage prohead protease